MKISEVTNIPQTYLATVRVVLRDSSITARSTISADTLQQARAIRTRTFGDGNGLSINHVMAEDDEVTEGTKTLSPQELQVKSLADQAKRLNHQAKLKRVQTGLAKAQEKLRVACSDTNN